MADKNTPYSDIWAAWSEMDTEQRKSIGIQMFSFLKGASLSGVVEILSNAPLTFKKAAWEQWAADADLSGYLLGEVVSLQDTETPSIAYSIVKRWLQQADLKRANETQMVKMASVLTAYEDKVSLWMRWAQSIDLTQCHVVDLAKMMTHMYSSVAIAINEMWIKANGRDAVAQLKSLSRSDNIALDKCHLPQEVYDRWIALRGA